MYILSQFLLHIQDLEGSAIANILRNAPSQAVVPYITADNCKLQKDRNEPNLYEEDQLDSTFLLKVRGLENLQIP